MNPLRIAIAGSTGRMGRTLTQLVVQDPAYKLVAAVTVPNDPRLGHDAGQVAGVDPLDLPITAEVTVACDVLIEFTLPAGCERWAQWCAAQGVSLVSGTTGLSAAQEAKLRRAAESVPIVWAPNMSVGINLLLELVADVAARLDETWDIEICETHHRQKIDAPSGTAKALLAAAAAARKRATTDVVTFGRTGNCGPRPTGQIGVHAMRMGAIVGEHEVYFTSAAESLTLRHRAFSRDTFAVGALRAARWIAGRPPGLYAMHDVLFT